jgi:hypothetical protein
MRPDPKRMRLCWILLLIAVSGPVVAQTTQPDTRASFEQSLPPGYVRGDIVSYSYVPIRTWTPREGIGILPYLFEYHLIQHDDRWPLESFHAENVRRIDIASRWSTAIMLPVRHEEDCDELINLMMRCFHNRQLLVMADYYSRDKQEATPYRYLRTILNKLWRDRDRVLASPEGDKATGQQLINNILANKCGDEEECGLRTDGLQQVYDSFDAQIRLRIIDGEQPFRHIKAWYNMIGYAALDYDGCYAASQADVDRHHRFKLPANTQAIGVDVYHYWGHKWSPFDPADLSIPREKVRAHTDEWHRLRTRYYPGGLAVRVCEGSNDPSTWVPECWNDTHALMSAIELAGAKNAMMWYIGVAGQLDGSGGLPTFTTPIETMQAYYDELKAGPWVALCWWMFGGYKDTHGGLEYYDKTLKHFTPQHPEGEPYSQEMLDYWHREYVALKMRMFNDVVYGQFRHLNGEASKAGNATEPTSRKKRS